MALVRGAPSATVAQRLGVDRRTIKRHRENCLKPSRTTPAQTHRDWVPSARRE